MKLPRNVRSLIRIDHDREIIKQSLVKKSPFETSDFITYLHNMLNDKTVPGYEQSPKQRTFIMYRRDRCNKKKSLLTSRASETSDVHAVSTLLISHQNVNAASFSRQCSEQVRWLFCLTAEFYSFFCCRLFMLQSVQPAERLHSACYL